jgi:hypothetical protein
MTSIYTAHMALPKPMPVSRLGHSTDWQPPAYAPKTHAGSGPQSETLPNSKPTGVTPNPTPKPAGAGQQVYAQEATTHEQRKEHLTFQPEDPAATHSAPQDAKPLDSQKETSQPPVTFGAQQSQVIAPGDLAISGYRSAMETTNALDPGRLIMTA